MNGTSPCLQIQEKREAIHYAAARGLSERRACSLVVLNRSTARYELRRPDADDALLTEKIKAIQTKSPRFGVRRVHNGLERAGETVNHKRVQRVMRVAGNASQWSGSEADSAQKDNPNRCGRAVQGPLPEPGLDD